MCCNVKECCCGCTSLRIGLMIMSGIDIIYNLTLAIAIGYALGNFLPTLFNAILIITEILLFFGSYFRKSGIIVPFLVVMMINIIASFLLWIVAPVLYFTIVAWEIASKNVRGGINFKSDNDGIDLSINGYYGSQVEGSDLTRFYLSYFELFAFLAIHIALAPFYYIYFWIVANSYMKSLNEEPVTTIMQIQPAHQPGQLAYQSGQLANQPGQLAYQPGQLAYQQGQSAYQQGQPVQPVNQTQQPGLPFTIMKGKNEQWPTEENPPGYLA